MVRGKKKEELTLEEKLERALVLVDEQPYEVPGNWCWTRLEYVADGFQYGCTEKATYESVGPKYIRITDIGNGEINEESAPYCKISDEVLNKYKIRKNDILIARMGSVGENGFAKRNMDAVFASYLIRIKPKIVPFYIKYYFQSSYYWFQVTDKSQGTTRMNVNANVLRNIYIPLPSLSEQQRIVERIEGLFAKLDEAKEKVQEVQESYLARRATILSLAFTGKLTLKWRTQNNIANNWNKKMFSEVAVIKSNLVQPSEYPDFPHIAPDNIEKRTGVLLQFNTIAEDKVTSGKHRFYPGQILYSKIRPYLSKVVMVDFDGLCSADMYPIEAKGNTKYLWYYMLSNDFLEQASSAGSRSVLPKINQKELSKLYVNIPDIEEQKEVVKILDKVLPYEQKVAERMEIILEQVDVMKKSILSKAFRGELGTNNPDEESAIELLKTILLET